MTEKEIEERLIHQLNITNQWKYEPKIKNIDDIWNNLRNILNINNVSPLNGIPLSDKEFSQIKNQLAFSSNFEAAKYLIGQNGIAHVDIKRNDKPISLKLFFRNSRFGQNIYQVINQCIIPQNVDMSEKRIFDVTLLINGLPLIQIELKKQDVSDFDAFEQIKKYEMEGCYRGIFRFIEMFVISNSSVTRYFAAGNYNDIAKTHLNSWRDKDNKLVNNLVDFTNAVLKRPMAYDFITRYSVLEEDKQNGSKKIILLRPYQIHAIEKIEEASKKGISGYIWHTTGSGKTLTSYKSTRNLINDIPSIKKAIFLVDRKDLDTQTSTSFLAYSENDVIDVDSTSSTFDLKNKLYSTDELVIVTTIQKLNLLIKELNLKQDKYYQEIKSKNIAFVVDECHRTISPEKMFEVRKFFQKSLWYGFTGTPRFEENAYQNNGYALTTDELYGKLNYDKNTDCCLHKYTIENAIRDNTVLAFNVKYMGSEDEEDENNDRYLTESHMLSVIKNIIRTFNIYGLENGVGNTFESILTVPNIKIAQKYYELFKEVMAGKYKNEGVCVHQKILEVLPDFPKFAISYSVADDNDNTDKFDYNKQKMQESINDYNKMFGTSLDADNIDSYNQDLQNRLTRKNNKFQNRSEQLDLVIVVNRLLTGFDSAKLDNLFIDRQPSELHTIIQMFSRTNRIDPKMNKEYGNIITYQSPELWKSEVKRAISLFTNGGEKYALARDYSEVKKDFLDKYNYLKAFIIKHPSLDELEDFLTEDEQKEFMKNVQGYDKLLKEIKTYVDYANDKACDENGVVIEKDKPISDMKVYDNSILPEIERDVFDEMRGEYNHLVKKFKETSNIVILPDGFDINYVLETKDRDLINIEYIASLIDAYNNNPNKKLEDDIVSYIIKVQAYNPKLGAIIQTYFNEIKENPLKYKCESSLNVIGKIKDDIIKKKCKEYSDKYNLNYEALYYSASNYFSLIENSDDISEIQAIIKNAKIDGVIPFKAKRIIKDEIKKMFDEEILPLNKEA